MFETKSIRNMTLQGLIGSLQSHEAILKEEEEAFDAVFRARFKNLLVGQKNQGTRSSDDKGENSKKSGRRWCSYCKKSNHTIESCFKLKNKKPDHSNRSKKECYFCHKPGHFARDCRLKLKDSVQAAIKEEEKDEPEIMLMAREVEVPEEEQCVTAVEKAMDAAQQDLWLVDSGCTNHMVKDRDYFVNMDRSFRVPIEIGDGSLISTEGRGDVAVETNGGRRLIKDVYFIPKMSRNLLSVWQMNQHGYKVVFDEGICTIWDKKRDQQLISNKARGKNFYVEWIKPGAALISEESKDSRLWHMRLGHIGFGSLSQMSKKNMVLGLPSLSFTKEVCEACQHEKQHRHPFPDSETRGKQKFELIHADLCGPMSTESLTGRRYFMILIDDFSRMVWVYFLKNKSDALEVFKKFKNLVENQSGCRIKWLRTDRGGEFCSKDFEAFCSNHGIARQTTTPYTPQQNGVAERRNRVMMEMARAMLDQSGLSREFWLKLY